MRRCPRRPTPRHPLRPAANRLRPRTSRRLRPARPRRQPKIRLTRRSIMRRRLRRPLPHPRRSRTWLPIQTASRGVPANPRHLNPVVPSATPTAQAAAHQQTARQDPQERPVPPSQRSDDQSPAPAPQEPQEPPVPHRGPCSHSQPPTSAPSQAAEPAPPPQTVPPGSPTQTYARSRSPHPPPGDARPATGPSRCPSRPWNAYASRPHAPQSVNQKP
jgi:hypothetical protein